MAGYRSRRVEGRLGWFHAGVLTPEGTVIDVVGEHDRNDWLTEHAGVGDAYGYDLQAEDPDYEYDGGCIQVYDATDGFAWSDTGFHEQHDPGVHKRTQKVAGLLVEPRAAGTLPRPGDMQ